MFYFKFFLIKIKIIFIIVENNINKIKIKNDLQLKKLNSINIKNSI